MVLIYWRFRQLEEIILYLIVLDNNKQGSYIKWKTESFVTSHVLFGFWIVQDSLGFSSFKGPHCLYAIGNLLLFRSQYWKQINFL